MKTKDAYKLEMEAQLKEWRTQLELMEARIVDADAAVAFNPGIESSGELDAGSSASWGQVKESADKIWDDLKSGFFAAK